MKLATNEFLHLCEQTLQYAQKQREDLSSLRQALIAFVQALQISRLSQTHGAFIDYFSNEMYVFISKMERIFTDFIAVMYVVYDDADHLFQTGGSINLADFDGTEKQSLAMIAEDLTLNIADSTAGFDQMPDALVLPQLEFKQEQEPHYKLDVECIPLFDLLKETDNSWAELLLPMRMQIKALQNLLTHVKQESRQLRMLQDTIAELSESVM